MASVHKAYINAVLADASYVDNLPRGATGNVLEGLLTPRMTPTLAKYIGAGFSMLTQAGDLGSGFDATVWMEKATGNVYVSMHGTQGARDIAEDATHPFDGLQEG